MMRRIPIRAILGCAGAALLLAACGTTEPDDTIYAAAKSEPVAAKAFEEGDRLYKEKEYVEAHAKYEEGLSISPLSPRAEAVIKRQLEMGKSLLYAEPYGPFGLPVLRIFDTKAKGERILQDIVSRAAIAAENRAKGRVGIQSFQAMEEAQWALAVYYFTRSEYEEALKQFEALVKNYPNGDWTIKATWYGAECYFRRSKGAEYDEGVLDEALKRFRHFLDRYPFPEYASEEDTVKARERIRMIENRKAQKRHLIALRYVEQKRYKAARRYCEAVMEHYPDADCAQNCSKLLERVKDTLTRLREVE